MSYISAHVIPDDNEIVITPSATSNTSPLRHSVRFGGVSILLTKKGMDRLAFEVRVAQDGES